MNSELEIAFSIKGNDFFGDLIKHCIYECNVIQN